MKFNDKAIQSAVEKCVEIVKAHIHDEWSEISVTVQYMNSVLLDITKEIEKLEI